MEIGLPVPKKKIFKRDFTIYGLGGHLGHVTNNMSSNFHFLYLKAFIQNLIQNGTVVSEKIFLNFCMALIGQAVSEKKMFEHCGRRTNDGRTTTDAGPWVYCMYKLPYEPLAQVS